MSLVQDRSMQEVNMPPPPAFSDNEKSADAFTDAEQPPSYETPTFNDLASDSQRLSPATCKFPPTMNGYFSWKCMRTFHLGPSGKEKLFAVGMHSGLFNGRPPMILYDGPTDQHPVLATAKSEKHILSRHLQININPSANSPNGASIPFNSCAHTFSVTAPGPGKESTEVQYEWRRSHGNEIKQLAGHSYGWKLVRSAGPSAPVGGKRGQRAVGITSDGKEVLALIAYNMSSSMTKGLKFAFMGEGLTGVLGEEWEIATVSSGLWLWFMDTQMLITTAAVS